MESPFPSPRRRSPTAALRRPPVDPFAAAAHACPGCIDVAAAAADVAGGSDAGGSDAGGNGNNAASCFGTSAAAQPPKPRRGNRTCYCCRREGFCRRCCRRYLLLDPARVHLQWAAQQEQQRQQQSQAAAAAAAAAARNNCSRGSSMAGVAARLFSDGGKRAGATDHAYAEEDNDDSGHGWGWMRQQEAAKAREREEGERRRRDAAARLEAAVARAAAKKAAEQQRQKQMEKQRRQQDRRRSSSRSGHSSRIPTSPAAGVADDADNNAPAPPVAAAAPLLTSFAPPADEVWDSAPNTPRGPATPFDDDDDDDYNEEEQQQHSVVAPFFSSSSPLPAQPPLAPSSAFPPVSPLPQRVCGSCFDRHVAYDPSRDHDVYGPPEPPTLSCTRPPVVLVPPALASRGALRPIADALAALHFRAEAADLPGLGSRWREDLTPESALLAVDAAVRRGLARGHGRVLLAGHGMGGLLACKYASLRPEGLLGVVATGCVGRGAAAALLGGEGGGCGGGGDGIGCAAAALELEAVRLALAGESAALERGLTVVFGRGGSGGVGGGSKASAASAEAEREQMRQAYLRSGGAQRAAWRGCAAILRDCSDMPAQLRACREGRVPVLLGLAPGAGGGGGGGGGKTSSSGSGKKIRPPPRHLTAAERACLDALGPYGHRFSLGGGGGGAGGQAGTFPADARSARSWAHAVGAFCDERI
jgi:pimeloyl-ACP methyl ester carboxylesterase